jgi:hypothetical protein
MLKQWMLAEIKRIEDPDSATSAVSFFCVAVAHNSCNLEQTKE